MIRSPTIRELVLSVRKGRDILIEGAKVGSVSAIACNAGAAKKRRRRFITRQVGPDVRVWRIE